MPHTLRTTLLLALGTLALPQAGAQALPLKWQPNQLFAFAGANATETGLASGRNLGITAGADLAFLPIHRLVPSLELRGTIPIDKGQVDSQSNFLGGLKVGGRLHQFQPYGNFLFGRGEIDYGAGYQVPQKPIFYTKSHTNVLALGGGLDLALSPQIALKVDAQLQRYSTPVTTTKHLYATAATLAVVYRFNFNRPTRQPRPETSRPPATPTAPPPAPAGSPPETPGSAAPITPSPRPAARP